MVLLLRCDMWACKGPLVETKNKKTWLLIYSGGFNVKTIESIKTTSIYELF